MNQQETHPNKTEEILNDLKWRLREFYGDRLVSIILYGSHARGDAEEGSDIDIVMALSECVNPLEERDRMGDILYELDVKYDTVISVVVVDARDLDTRETPFLLNVRREGIVL